TAGRRQSLPPECPEADPPVREVVALELPRLRACLLTLSGSLMPSDGHSEFQPAVAAERDLLRGASVGEVRHRPEAERRRGEEEELLRRRGGSNFDLATSIQSEAQAAARRPSNSTAGRTRRRPPSPRARSSSSSSDAQVDATVASWSDSNRTLTFSIDTRRLISIPIATMLHPSKARRTVKDLSHKDITRPAPAACATAALQPRTAQPPRTADSNHINRSRMPTCLYPTTVEEGRQRQSGRYVHVTATYVPLMLSASV
ncbi:hypothetical protein THAOC_07678, partial [Thalassiosira oceanica]